ncbi:PTS sugar transporter subunit IIB, partial [Enterobacter intestinihominis]
MYEIVLWCAEGISTYMLVQPMTDPEQNKGGEVTSSCVRVGDVKDKIGSYYLVLLGPQVKYEQAKLQAQADPL